MLDSARSLIAEGQLHSQRFNACRSSTQPQRRPIARRYCSAVGEVHLVNHPPVRGRLYPFRELCKAENTLLGCEYAVFGRAESVGKRRVQASPAGTKCLWYSRAEEASCLQQPQVRVPLHIMAYEFLIRFGDKLRHSAPSCGEITPFSTFEA